KRSSWKRWRCSGPAPPPGCTTVSALSIAPEADASTSTTLWMPSPSAENALSSWSRYFGVDAVCVVIVRYDSPTELSCQVSELNPPTDQLLRATFRRFEEELAAALAAPREQFGVRPVHDAVLAYLDRDGTRASVLADRARLSRQAITQLVDELEDRGVVVRLPDPADGRAKIIQYTPEALKIFDASRRTLAPLDRPWPPGLGPRKDAAMRAGLEQLLREREE